jgi:hypothetical protein
MVARTSVVTRQGLAAPAYRPVMHCWLLTYSLLLLLLHVSAAYAAGFFHSISSMAYASDYVLDLIPCDTGKDQALVAVKHSWFLLVACCVSALCCLLCAGPHPMRQFHVLAGFGLESTEIGWSSCRSMPLCSIGRPSAGSLCDLSTVWPAASASSAASHAA